MTPADALREAPSDHHRAHIISAAIQLIDEARPDLDDATRQEVREAAIMDVLTRCHILDSKPEAIARAVKAGLSSEHCPPWLCTTGLAL